MGIKRKNKVSALFNMSSLTDIIFLLLIFFMLTSSLVSPNALNLKLPGKSQSTTPPTEKLTNVDVRANGSYAINGETVNGPELERRLTAYAGRSGQTKSFTIAPQKETPVEYVVFVMDIAMRLRLNAVLLPEK